MLRFLFFLYGKYSNLFREQMLVQMCVTQTKQPKLDSITKRY